MTAAAIAICAYLLSGCSPTAPRIVFNSLDAELHHQYHACIPLGWDPVPVAGYYYPGYSSEYREEGVWLHPYWIGVVYRSQLADQRVRTAQQVMNVLVREGMLERSPAHDAMYYHLTPRALPYYFEGNSYGNNPDHLPYLCYSTIVPAKILSTGPITRRTFHSEFVWRTSSPAAWAMDPFLQSHSVILPPLTARVSAKFENDHGSWYLQKLWTSTPMLPRVVNPLVWPADRILRYTTTILVR